MNEIRLAEKLAAAQEMLNGVFSDECRPSMRWLSGQAMGEKQRDSGANRAGGGLCRV